MLVECGAYLQKIIKPRRATFAESAKLYISINLIDALETMR